MAKKGEKDLNEVDGTSVAESLDVIKDSSSGKVSDKVFDAVKDLEKYQESLKKTRPVTLSLRRRTGFVSCGFKPLVVSVSPSVGYPPSVTDQVHALSVSQQVRSGSAQAIDDFDKDSFDFPNGVDDGSEAHNIFEFSNRVDAWIAEQNLSDELRSSFRAQVLQQQADQAMSESIKQAQQQQQQQQQEQQQQQQQQEQQ